MDLLFSLAGRMPDSEAGRLANVSGNCVRQFRRRNGIKAFGGKPKTRRWTKANDRLLGTMSDGAIAAKLGCSVRAVQARRTRLGISAKLLRHTCPNCGHQWSES